MSMLPCSYFQSGCLNVLFLLSAILKLVEAPSFDINAMLNSEGHLPLSSNVGQDVSWGTLWQLDMVGWKIPFSSMIFSFKCPFLTIYGGFSSQPCAITGG